MIMPDSNDNAKAPRSLVNRVRGVLWNIWPVRMFYDELGMFDSVEAARAAYDAARQELRWESRTVLYWIGFIIAVVLFKLFTLRYGPLLPYVSDGTLFLAFLVGGSVLGPELLFGSDIRRSLRRRLNEQGKPVCMECGYRLLGNVSGECPECGKPTGREEFGEGSSEDTHFN